MSNEKRESMSCADCAVINCDVLNRQYPEFCQTTKLTEGEIQRALAGYEEGDFKKVMLAAAEVEYEGYGKLTRVAETIELSKKLGVKKIGIATCIGLISETRALAKVLRSHGFEVFGVACKVGAVSKTTVGIDPKCQEIGANMCNPILQAQLLNKEKTDLNIIMGLCVGHDGLFCKHSDALVTTLVAKDRVTGHNPCACLYTLGSYYSKLIKK